MIDYGHNILGESARFIRADNLRTAQRFNCRHFTDYRVAFGHIGYAYGKHNSHNCDKAFGNGRNRKSYSGNKAAERKIKEIGFIGYHEILGNDIECENEYMPIPSAPTTLDKYGAVIKGKTIANT